ncbi:MAG: hypothetical protein V4584_07960 [Verrucomicrobiota bacterium]
MAHRRKNPSDGGVSGWKTTPTPERLKLKIPDHFRDATKMVRSFPPMAMHVPFDIYIPATEHRAAVRGDTILIEVYTDDFGNEMVTTASTELIQKTRPAPFVAPALLGWMKSRLVRSRLFKLQSMSSGHGKD